MEEQEQRTEPQDDEERSPEEHFTVVGVQMGMRRHVVRNLVSTTVTIGNTTIHGYRCQMVNPGVRDDDPPELLEAIIPIDKVELFIIQPEGQEQVPPAAEGAGERGPQPDEGLEHDNGKKSAEELEAEEEALASRP